MLKFCMFFRPLNLICLKESKMVFRSKPKLIGDLVGDIGSNIYLMNVISIGIILGLFVNYLSDIKVVFNDGCLSSLAWCCVSGATIYYCMAIAVIFLFAGLVYKYLMMTVRCDKLKKIVEHDGVKRFQAIDRMTVLVKEFVFDWVRYLLLLAYLVLLLSKSIPLKVHLGLSIDGELSFIFIAMFLGLLVIIELPTLRYAQLYRAYVREPYSGPEQMEF